MQHGFEASADDWVLSTPDRAPALVAAAAGYDVWVSNSRGNCYSREHVTLDAEKDEEYWRHSFTEIGRYDVPAFLKYIFIETNCAAEGRKISLMAHSQGTAASLYGLVKLPELFQEHVSNVALFSPVGLMNSMEPLVHAVGRFALDHEQWLRNLGMNELLPKPKFNIAPIIVQLFPSLAMAIMHLATTEYTPNVDVTVLKSYVGHYPAGSALSCALHIW